MFFTEEDRSQLTRINQRTEAIVDRLKTLENSKVIVPAAMRDQLLGALATELVSVRQLINERVDKLAEELGQIKALVWGSALDRAEKNELTILLGDVPGARKSTIPISHEALRQCLRVTQMSQAELSRLCGVTEPSVHYWIKGESMPKRSAKTLKALKDLQQRAMVISE